MRRGHRDTKMLAERRRAGHSCGTRERRPGAEGLGAPERSREAGLTRDPQQRGPFLARKDRL